jgi:hypothetical protein
MDVAGRTVRAARSLTRLSFDLLKTMKDLNSFARIVTALAAVIVTTSHAATKFGWNVSSPGANVWNVHPN